MFNILNSRNTGRNQKQNLWLTCTCQVSCVRPNFIQQSEWYVGCLFARIKLQTKSYYLYVLIMSRTRFRVNPHPIVARMSRYSLLETDAITEVSVTATGLEPTTN